MTVEALLAMVIWFKNGVRGGGIEEQEWGVQASGA